MMASGQGLRLMVGAFMGKPWLWGRARTYENSLHGFKAFAFGVNADLELRAGAAQQQRLYFDEDGRLRELGFRHHQFAATHYVQVALQVFQLQLDRNVARSLVDNLQQIEVFDLPVRHLLEERAWGPKESGFDLGARDDEEEEQSDQRRQHAQIKLHARGESEGFAFLNAVERGETNQPARAVDLLHHGVAGVDAGGAVDAFHLRAISDVDASRTHGDALAAVNAIAQAGGLTLLGRFAAMEWTALLAAFEIVSHDHRVFVPHRRLQATVGADERASLFTEAREDRVEQQREQSHERQPDEMVQRVIRNEVDESVAADDVAQERVPDQE